jgi:hypothetical protein
MSESYQTLRNALIARKSCVAQYDGYTRYICPHVIGWKDGAEQALCWQYAGQSSRPLPPEGQWKCLTVSKISGLSVIDEPFHYGQAGKTGKPTSCVGQVDQEILL